MKLTFISSVFILIGFTSFGQKTIDKIAAQVGDNIILMSDIEAQKLQAVQAGVVVTPQLDCDIIEELMYQNLLLNQAKLDSIEIPEEQVDAEMQSRLRVIENQIGGRDKMEAFYGKTTTQIMLEFRPIIHDQLLAQEMERVITSEISLTPREVEEFYLKIPIDSIPLINTQLSFQQIVQYPKITAEDKLETKKKLENIRKSIVDEGKSFSTQALINSEDPGSAAKGGEIKASKGMMVRPFESAVFNLQPGEISEVFESEYGYHIVQLIERKGDDYTCRHILLSPKFNDLAIQHAAIQLDSCYNLLKENKITWDEAVLKFSNDETTRLNGGIITNPITGEQTWDTKDLNQVDQQIYLLTDQMNVGDISSPSLYDNPFERKQGVRLVRLMSRSDPHRANLTQDYSLIQRAAENDKKQLVINEWISSKIGSAYIRINPPYSDCNFNNPWLK